MIAPDRGVILKRIGSGEGPHIAPLITQQSKVVTHRKHGDTRPGGRRPSILKRLQQMRQRLHRLFFGACDLCASSRRRGALQAGLPEESRSGCERKSASSSFTSQTSERRERGARRANSAAGRAMQPQRIPDRDRTRSLLRVITGRSTSPSPNDLCPSVDAEIAQTARTGSCPPANR